MIQITDKSSCCGCAACVQICPKKCISFDKDEKGFCYPKVDLSRCIKCGLCEAVCPYIQPMQKREPIKVLAAINQDEEIRLKSSSGGIFTMLAENIINAGGVVFGAAFDKSWKSEHRYTETIDGLEAFRGAKYIQSYIEETFKQVKSFLLTGRKVLFSGTGCQIAGLRLFLRKDYENLLTVEVACHGVPSPSVWRAYIDDIADGNLNKIKSISFRDKRHGWNSYGIAITTYEGTFYESASTNPYMQSFLKDLSLRPSCTNCPAKRGASGSDIIIGDFWGVDNMHPEIYDNKGCSLVLVNTQSGKELLNRLNIKGIEITYEESYRYNPCLIQSAAESRYASLFWNEFKRTGIRACERTLKLINSSKPKRILALILSKLLKNE